MIWYFVDLEGTEPYTETRVLDSIIAHGGDDKRIIAFGTRDDALPHHRRLDFVEYRQLAQPFDWAERFALLSEALRNNVTGCVLSPGVMLTPLTAEVIDSLMAGETQGIFSLPAGPTRNPLAFMTAALGDQQIADTGTELAALLQPKLRTGLTLSCVFAGKSALPLLDILGDADMLRRLGAAGLRRIAAKRGLPLLMAPQLLNAGRFNAIHACSQTDEIAAVETTDQIAFTLFNMWGITPASGSPRAIRRLAFAQRRKQRLLHIVHGWGGGSRRWIDLFAATDDRYESLVLESFSGGPRSSQEFFLRHGIDETANTQRYVISTPIYEISFDNHEYATMLRRIIREERIDAIVVSSLIGHSLECLHTGLPTNCVLHDFFPYCIGLNLTFKELCTSCDSTRLDQCLRDNPYSTNFRRMPLDYWQDIREQWRLAIEQRNIPLAAPSAYVKQAFEAHQPWLKGRIDVIPHPSGMPKDTVSTEWHGTSGNERFRIVIPGLLAHHKGLDVATALIKRFPDIDFHLVGCHDLAYGKLAGLPNVFALPHYHHGDLLRIFQDIRPHLGLLLSLVPETFSLTLSELQQLSIPVLATSLGAIGQRVLDSGCGIVAEPKAGAFQNALEALMADPPRLAALRQAAIAVMNPTADEVHALYRSQLRLADDQAGSRILRRDIMGRRLAGQMVQRVRHGRTG